MSKLILLALDASPRANDVRDSAVELARALGAKIHLFRAVTFPPELPAEAFEVSPNELVHVLERHAREGLEVIAGGIPREMLAGLDVHVGTPWQAICRAATEHDADLVVIGSHGYSGLDKVLGTTAGKVVNHADRSVFVVRARPTTATAATTSTKGGTP